MKVLYAASEALPFIKSGGLGDVAGSLPAALHKKRTGIRVVLPLYEGIPAKLRANMKFIKSIYVQLAWRNQYCGIFQSDCDGVRYILIDNEYYFKRENLYGYFDDAERFCFFSKAVLDIIPHINFKPDVLHCNDWQTAPAIIYLKRLYGDKEKYRDIKTVFTIHNIQYQGRYSKDIVEDVMGLPVSEYDSGTIEYGGCVNLLKAAIQLSDSVTTVSPTYACEIQTPEFAHGLDPLLRANAAKLTGIVNGIDTVSFDPEHDTRIQKNYGPATRADKAANKSDLQHIMGLTQREDVPVIGIISRLVAHKGMDLVNEVIHDILKEDVQLVVLGKGDWKYEEMMREVARNYPGRAAVRIAFNADLAQRIYAGADMFLMPSHSEPCGLAQMIAMRYGTVPIVRSTGGLKDTVKPCAEGASDGNGFVFDEYDANRMLDAVKRAIKCYYDKPAWDEIVKRDLESDFSWGRSAGEYIRLYRELTGKR